MDIKLYSNDIKIQNGILDLDNGLQTAIYISLFTDRRIGEDDEIPDRSNDRRGYWGDALEEEPLGSFLWTLDREKITNSVLNKIDTYSKDALNWLIEDGIASEINTIVERDSKNIEQINIEIQIIKPDEKSESYRYSLNWEAVKNAV